MENIIDIIHKKIIFENKHIYIIFDRDSNPWFKAKDVATILCYENTNDAINKHVKEKYKTTFEQLVIRGDRDSLPLNTIFINEPGLYSLIMKSRLPSAIRFQEWVFEDVLPTIRKYGEYKLKSKIFQLEKRIEELEKLKNEGENKNEYLQHQLCEQKSKVAVMPENEDLIHVFCVLMRHLDDENNRYKCVRTQKRRIERSLDEAMEEDDNYVVVYKREYIPNGINILNCIKEKMKKKNMQYESKNNYIDTKYDLIEMVEEILPPPNQE